MTDRTFDHIFTVSGEGHPHQPRAGARLVIGQIGETCYPCGWLMPTMFDSRQQPKSLGMKLIEERRQREKDARLTGKVVERLENLHKY